MDFSSAIQAQLAGRLVRVDALVEFEFVSETIRLWNGFGTLPTLDSETWEGLGGIGRVDGLEQATNGVAPTQTFTVSGVDDRFRDLAKGGATAVDEYFGQPARVFLQFFGEDWQVLDEPFAISVRLMDRLTASLVQTEEGQLLTVGVKAETPFGLRRRSPNAYYTERDQKNRFPDDLGFDFVMAVERTIVWPAWKGSGGSGSG